jgi:hypothetical protein
MNRAGFASTLKRRARKAREIGLRSAAGRGWAQLWFAVGPRLEFLGIQALPVHYYSPIPSLRDLRRRTSVLSEPSALVGIDTNDDAQTAFITQLATVADEVRALPSYADFERRSPGEGYGVGDSQILYSWVRTHKPRHVVEIGSGVSTHYIVEALRRNADDGTRSTLTCVEPYRWQGLDRLGDERVKVDVRRTIVQDLDLSFFETLEAGDLLFIDSSHVVKVGSDTSFLILEVLPRLAPGVFVHVHDIPFPYAFVDIEIALAEHMFWNEVAMLQAFLSFNQHYSVRLMSFWLSETNRDLMMRAAPSLEDPHVVPSSLWLERVR